jgi:phospholipase C
MTSLGDDAGRALGSLTGALSAQERALLGGIDLGVLPGVLQGAIGLLTETPAPTPTATTAVTVDAAVESLDRIDHIVVVMLENRSFDSMLGYLALAGNPLGIDGLDSSLQNMHAGQPYPVREATRTKWNGELEDPCHGPDCIDQQIAGGGMSGFVDAYAEYVQAYKQKNPGARSEQVDLGLVMSYFTAAQLPVFDHLARSFCVCDRWFSSVPGATWPNRLYALAGRCDGDREDKSPAPIYNLATFPRYLDANHVQWSWYSYDPGTLRLADAEYRLTHHANFSYVDQRKLSSQEQAAGAVLDEERSFIDDVAAGSLPAVSWIDPRFKDASILGGEANDDHPPSDVTAGQSLVLDVYNALRSNDAVWQKTLLVITYDEHGGIYDHVAPPAAPDDHPGFQRYGVRVPALVVSPYVMRGVANVTRNGAAEKPVFDHTSIIKTILLRFCRDRAANTIPDMGLRTTSAEHLGVLLTQGASTSDDPTRLDAVKQTMAAWHAQRAAERYAPPAPAPQRSPVNHLQHGLAVGARALREAGLPAGHP